MPQSSQPNSKGLAARQAALHALLDVLRRGRSLDEALDRPEANALETRDRGFYRQLVMTALRRRGQILALLQAFLTKALPRSAGPTEMILSLAACELLFMEVAPHAAVSSAVALAAQDKDAQAFRGLVNAIARRIAREGPSIAATQDAARLNTPDWLWESWTSAYGEASARAIARAHLAEAPLDITVKRDPAGWAGRLEAELLPTGTLRRWSGGLVESLPGYSDGEWWIQDAAAALIPRFLPDIADQRVLDLCAAPGGKTLWLAAQGAKVTALDRSAPRLERLKANLLRTRLNAEIVRADGTEWRANQPFSRVLLDAPCSASGTIRRHPDIAWSKRPSDLAALVALQRRLLESAIANTAPGGIIVYATCSLEPPEGRDQIARLLADGAPLGRDPIRLGEIEGLDGLLNEWGEFRSLPSHWPESGGLDGFFACRLIRC